jgi:peptide/nickel transport system permease protein
MGLKKYVTRRILQLLFTYWAFLTILFGVFRLAPGDPTSMYLAQEMGPEERQRILEQYGLNEPMHIQYFDFLAQFLTGDFGQSFRFGEPVWDVMVVKFWNTILLMGVAFLLAYTIGVLLGAFLGWVRQTRTEKAGIIVTLLARSSPEFWIGIVVLMVFPFGLGWFPAGGMRSPGAEWSWFWGRYLSWDFVEHMVLPVLTGVIYYMATPTLLMRSSMINVLDADFIDIKKAEGIPEHIILYKHAARNSILPMVTVVALVVGLSIGGSLVIETVFNWPGMGRAMINAVTYNDYPLAQALFFLMGSIVILMNFVADMAYVYLDPRVRYD